MQAVTISNIIVWRKAVKERDNYICRACGREGNNTSTAAHHISKGKAIRLDLDNGMTLCRYTCHKELHKLKNALSNKTVRAPDFNDSEAITIEQATQICNTSREKVNYYISQGVIRATKAIRGRYLRLAINPTDIHLFALANKLVPSHKSKRIYTIKYLMKLLQED